MVGSGSGNDGCPTLYEVDGPDQYLVQGDTVTDPGEIAQLSNVKDGESAVVVPRALLANFGPKEPVATRESISFEDFGRMFTTLRHSAWRLETRGRYASDGVTETYAQFLRDGVADWDFNDRGASTGTSRPHSVSASSECASWTPRPPRGSGISWTTPAATPPSGNASALCHVRRLRNCACPQRTSGSSTHGWSLSSASTTPTR